MDQDETKKAPKKNASKEDFDRFGFEILKSLLANSNVYQPHAGNDEGVIKTAIRLRQAAHAAGLVPPVNASSKS